MRTRINFKDGTYVVSYTDDVGVECYCAREKTKDAVIHKLLRTIKKHDALEVKNE